MKKYERILAEHYTDSPAPCTVTCNSIQLTGIMYGDDECFELNCIGESYFYQILLTDNKCYKCKYGLDNAIPLDCIDYEHPYEIEVLPEDYFDADNEMTKDENIMHMTHSEFIRWINELRSKEVKNGYPKKIENHKIQIMPYNLHDFPNLKESTIENIDSLFHNSILNFPEGLTAGYRQLCFNLHEEEAEWVKKFENWDNIFELRFDFINHIASYTTNKYGDGDYNIFYLGENNFLLENFGCKLEPFSHYDDFWATNDQELIIINKDIQNSYTNLYICNDLDSYESLKKELQYYYSNRRYN